MGSTGCVSAVLTMSGSNAAATWERGRPRERHRGGRLALLGLSELRLFASTGSTANISSGVMSVQPSTGSCLCWRCASPSAHAAIPNLRRTVR